jgi:ABC-type transport system involved in multi-copper enzyme maturation permease subunit
MFSCHKITLSLLFLFSLCFSLSAVMNIVLFVVSVGGCTPICLLLSSVLFPVSCDIGAGAWVLNCWSYGEEWEENGLFQS